MNFENSELKLCPGLISCIYRLTFINVTDIKMKCMHIELIQQSESFNRCFWHQRDFDGFIKGTRSPVILLKMNDLF